MPRSSVGAVPRPRQREEASAIPLSRPRASKISPPPYPRCDSAGNPVRGVERPHVPARGKSSRTTPEELGVAVAREGLDHREVATSISFGFCVNVCVWRQSGEVELFKCSRVIIIFGCSSALCPCFCFFAFIVYVYENCCLLEIRAPVCRY